MEMGVAPVGSGLDTCGQLRSTMTLAPEKNNSSWFCFQISICFISRCQRCGKGNENRDLWQMWKRKETGTCGKCDTSSTIIQVIKDILLTGIGLDFDI